MMQHAKSLRLSHKSAVLIYHQDLIPALSLMLILLNKQPSLLQNVPCFTTPPIVYEDGKDNRSSMLRHKHLVSNQQQLLNNHYEYSFTYPSFILDVHVSSFIKKAFHCVITATAGCNMQGSLLIGESNKVCFNASNSRLQCNRLARYASSKFGWYFCW